MTRKTVAACALACAALTIAAPGAGASTSSGYRSGAADNPLIQGAIYPAQSAQFQIAGSNVYRSPHYAGRQYVSAKYYLYGWSSSSRRWVYKAFASDGCWLNPGEYCVTDPQAWNLSGYGDWTININYAWQTPSGSRIGYRNRQFVHAHDYACFVPSGMPQGSCAIRSTGGRHGMFIWGS